MPRVALVYPYFRTHAPTEILFTPLGVASIAAQLHQLGIEIRVFDCTFKTFDQIRKELCSYSPDIIGIYSMITLSRNAFRMAQIVRQDLPGSLLAAGGPLPTLFPERFIPAFDVIFRGEADLSFPQFCASYFSFSSCNRVNLSKMDLRSHAGLYVHLDGIHAENPTVHHSEKQLNTFPLPYRDDFDHPAYQAAGLERDGTRTTSIITTYGCSFNCDFCSKPIFGSLFRRRNLDSVFNEISDIQKWGYDNLWIADDNFTLDLNYLKEFCERMRAVPLGWTCLSRVNGITPEIARMMKSAGCRKVYFGLESGSQETLRLMHKRASVEDGIKAVHTFRDNGVETGGFFIVGYPGETLESIESTFQLALSLPLNEISFNVPFPLPGSTLFDKVSGVNPTMDWNVENEVTFVYASEFDETWLRARIAETMRQFATSH